VPSTKLSQLPAELELVPPCPLLELEPDELLSLCFPLEELLPVVPLELSVSSGGLGISKSEEQEKNSETQNAAAKDTKQGKSLFIKTPLFEGYHSQDGSPKTKSLLTLFSIEALLALASL
jgi:hypothetical protein